MDIGPSLIADGQPAVPVEPGQGALHHPAMAAQPLAGVDAFAGDAHPDVALGKRPATARDVVGLVGMQLVRALAAPAVGLLDRRDGIEQLLEDDRVVAVGRRSGAWPAGGRRGRSQCGVSCPVCRDPWGWDRPRRPPFGRDAGAVQRGPAPVDLAGFAEAIEQERDGARSQTPASCQSRSRRQQVIPEPQPISWGSISQGMPVFSTKMMPVKAARSGTRGRPPLGLGGSGGSSGATRAHSSSLTRVWPCPRSTMPAPVLLGSLSSRDPGPRLSLFRFARD